MVVEKTQCFHGGIYSVDPSLVKVDFSSNVNPLGISKKVLESIQKNVGSLSSIYPDSECRDLKKSIVDYLDCGLSLEYINVGNGATELIYDFTRAFVRNRVVIPAPTFCEYEHASKRMGADILLVPLKNLKLDTDLIIEYAKNSDAVFLCNPNNPTGLLSVKSIKKIIEHVDRSTKILIDECFIELVDSSSSSGQRQQTMIDKTKEFDNLIILRSLTKSFGLAGLRVGYSICNPKLSKQLSANRIPWNVNGLAQTAGIVALKDLNHLSKAKEIIKSERKLMQDRIKSRTCSFTPYKSDTNYFLIHLNNNISSIKIRDSLLIRSGVLVRDCSTFSGMGLDYIRVAVRTQKENSILLNALESIDN